MLSFQIIVPTELRQTNHKRIYIALEPLQKLKIATGDLIIIKHDSEQHNEKEVILRTVLRFNVIQIRNKNIYSCVETLKKNNTSLNLFRINSRLG